MQSSVLEWLLPWLPRTDIHLDCLIYCYNFSLVNNKTLDIIFSALLDFPSVLTENFCGFVESYRGSSSKHPQQCPSLSIIWPVVGPLRQSLSFVEGLCKRCLPLGWYVNVLCACIRVPAFNVLFTCSPTALCKICYY